MWLYIPGTALTSSASVPEAEGSTLPSTSPFPALAPQLWWRGKPSPSPIWLRRWKRASWLRRLSGRMCEPSTAALGAASWMALLAASRASRTALPDASAAASTRATSGHRPGASSPMPGHGSSSLKTSRACSRRGLTTSLEPSGFGETFADLVSRSRSDCSARVKSTRRRKASVSSFSAWPRPAARDHKGANGEAHLVAGTGRLHLDQLPNFVQHLWYPKASSHLGHLISKDGAPSSIERRSLNPLFVSWLMGWAPPASTGCGFLETAWFPFKARMRSALSSLGTPPAAPPVQPSLFR